ncbi:MAG: type II secretion system inner membrane protein GspF [Candidatus Azotimanducaceae bacterium]
MAAFEYLALDINGREKKGIVEADSHRQVRQNLRDKDLTPLSVKASEKKVGKGFASLFSGVLRTSLSFNERALLVRQLATLIAAGLPVEEALLAVSKQGNRNAIQSLVLNVRSKVLEGYSLAQAMADYPRAFPALHRSTVAAGESAGHLDLVLARLADFTETQQASVSKVKQALVYPIILLVLTLAILGGLLGYVVPDIVEVFADSEQELPWLTIAVINTSDFVVEWGGLFLLLLLLVGLGLIRLFRSPKIEMSFDKKLLGVPVVGKLSLGNNISQFASTLSILTSSGVPLVDAMQISSEVLSNTWLRTLVIDATNRVREGSTLYSALDQSTYFPPMMLHMIASGEASGELDQMLSRVAEHQEADASMILNVLVSIFGPLMLVFMGGAVFTIVMAILLPIINLNQLVL